MAESEKLQLQPHDVWRCFDKYHWKHWHGIWVHWAPLDSAEVNKTYRSVRSFQAVNPERSLVKHENQWYNPQGTGEAPKWMFGPWILSEEEHSLPNGISHPALPAARTLVFPNGDAATVQTELSHTLAAEIYFVYPGEDATHARISVIVKWNRDGTLGGISLIPEEALESAERPGDAWGGHSWKHELAKLPLELNRDEPSGSFQGNEMVLTRTLALETVQNVAWKGFKSGLEAEDSPDHYSLIHLPYQLSVCFPTKVEEGKAFSLVVHRANPDEVRSISWRYSDGKLMQIKSARYKNVETV